MKYFLYANFPCDSKGIIIPILVCKINQNKLDSIINKLKGLTPEIGTSPEFLCLSKNV